MIGSILQGAHTRFTRSVLCFCVLYLLSRLLAIECAQQSADLVRNVTDASEHRIGRSDSGHESNSARLSARVLLVLKLLHLLHSSSHNSTLPMNSASESRSMTSWLHRLRRPVQRQESQFMMDRNAMSNQDFPSHGPPRQLLPPMMPANYNHFGKTQDPNSFLFVPSLADTSGIDYWLKFIENANLDDRNIAIFPKGKDNMLPKPIPMLRRNKNSRSKGKLRSGERKVSKMRPEMSKTPNLGEDYESDLSSHNDIGLDSKSTGSSNKVSKQAEYDSSPRCDKFTDEICIDDFEYPEHAILEEIFKRKDIFQLMYSEVKGDTPMVDGIPRDEEENFSQDYYYNNNENTESEDYEGNPTLTNRTQQLYNDMVENQEQSRLTHEKNDRGGFVCRSEVLYAKPKLARNIKGKWRVIVNAGDFTQTVRMEKCTKPNSECRFIAEHKYDSRCAQISAIHRLLVFEKGKGFYIDTFRIPTACTCHVHSTKADQTKPGTQFSVESSFSSSNPSKKDKSNLGDTLWSLLGTEPEKNKNTGANDHANVPVLNSFLQDNSKNGLNQLELLKLLPQLTSIAPENVLQQLLEDYTDTSSQQPQGYGHRVSNPLNDITSKVPTGELQQMLLAQVQRNELPKPGHIRAGEKVVSVPHPTTTTIVSPGGSQGAPVVQVIHVPVSSEMVTTDLESMPLENRRLSTRNRVRTVFSPSASTRITGKHPKYLISTSSSYMHSQSKTNSSVAPPPTPNTIPVTPRVDQPVPVAHMGSSITEEGQGGKDLKHSTDKKINFSYHPILEYIVH